MEDKVEYNSGHRDGYTACRHMHKEYGDNLLPGFIKLDQWSKARGIMCRVQQWS